MNSKEMRDRLETGLSKKKDITFLGKHASYGLVLKCISTGAPSLDRIIAKDIDGNWGFPCGRVCFVSGKPGSAKTTLCLHLCAQVQQAGGVACYIDGEYRIDRLYAQRIGVNIDELFYSAPESLEDVLETTEHTINIVKGLREEATLKKEISRIPIIVVVDSTSIATKAEMESEEYGKGGKGEHARLISQAMRKITPVLGKTCVCVLFVCQIKSKINMGYGTRGSNETFLAEDALRYHCSVGLRSVRISTLKDKDDIKYADVDKFVTTKNSCMAPLQAAEVEVKYGVGFNYYTSLTDTLLEHYGATVKGSWYSHDDLGKWQGKEGIKNLYEKDKDFSKKVAKILASPSQRKIIV